MLLRSFWAGLALFCMAAMGGLCGDKEDGLWLIEQDFVKFGKNDAYEKFKKEDLEGFWAYAKKGPYCTFAERGVDSPQYIYMVQVKDYSGLGEWMKKREGYNASLSRNALLPYLSTINFAIQSLHRYLSDCSFLPKGKESILGYGATKFFLYGVMPPNESDFEARLAKIATDQASSEIPVCFRTWKVVVGGDVPKYLIAVFAQTEKEAEAQAASLDITGGGIKNILRSQKSATALLRKDLSITAK